MRVPVVAGVGGGVGTTTVAAALRGHDAGRGTGRWPDILACRGTLDSLSRAAAILETADPHALPVLAVTLDAARAARPIRALLELLEPDLGALVVLPYVRRWTTLANPLAEAAQLLAEPPSQLPRPVRAYAAALRRLVEAVTADGRLDAAPDERRIQHVGSEPPHPRRVGSDGRNVRHAGRDERAVLRRSGATDGRPAPLPVGTGAPQRPRGIRIVRPNDRAERVG